MSFILTVLLWGIIVFAGLLFLSSLMEVEFIKGGLSLMILFLCINGLQRIDTSDTCDAINAIGGKATYLSGKCIILNSGGVPIEKGNDRLVYVNQQ